MPRLVFALLIVAAASNVRADYPGGSYMIPPRLDTAVQLENDIIKGDVDSVLRRIEDISGIALRPGRVVMRKKNSAGYFGLYEGALDTTAFTGAPPLYSFPFPHWARLEDMLNHRFYREATEAIGSDEATVYFDAERVYMRTLSQLCYFRNGIWFTMSGSRKNPFGSLSVGSTPPGAELLINGTSTRMATPCTVGGLIGGVYTIEVRMAEYQFFTKRVRVVADSTVHASFELISDVDTVYITGDAQYSLVLLPHPPIDRPYVVDDTLSIYGDRIRLSPGEHRISWNGDERYMSLDSVVDIPAGRVIYFDYLFKRRYGVVRIVPSPFDADVCIDRFGCSTGERIEELPAGLHRAYGFRQGFQRVKSDIHVKADTITTCNIDLRQVPDSDGDGFIDSVDECPDVYGLYNGCSKPRLRTALRTVFGEVGTFVASDSLTIGFSLLGFIVRTPSNRNFRNFLSVFSNGRAGGVNNYRGLTALNTVSVMYRGLFGMAELGQWSGGLRYQRRDTLALDSDHSVFFDSASGIEPRLYLPSTAVALGVHYNRSWLNIAYSAGYQWEDIILDDIYCRTDHSLVRTTFDNDWWFHQVNLEVDFNNGDLFVPAIYCNVRLPFGRQKYTHWVTLNAGLQLKIFTHPAPKRLKGSL